MNLASIGHEAADLIDRIATIYGEEVEIRCVMLLVEVDKGDGKTEFVQQCSDNRPWSQLAYMDEHKFVIEERRDAREAEASEDGDD